MAVESTVGELERLERKVFERLYSRARSLCSGDRKMESWLEAWEYAFRSLAYEIVRGSGSAEEAEARLAKVLDALPRYVELVKLGRHLSKLYAYSEDVLDSVKDLFGTLGLKPSKIEEFVREYGDRGSELAERIANPIRREAFVRALELAKQLRFLDDRYLTHTIETRSGKMTLRADADFPLRVYVEGMFEPAPMLVNNPYEFFYGYLKDESFLEGIEGLLLGLGRHLAEIVDNNERVMNEIRWVVDEAETEEMKVFSRITEEVVAKLESLCSGDSDLERWLAKKRVWIETFPEYLVAGARNLREVEERLKKVLEALPRYVRLVKRVLRVEKLREQAGKAVEVFKSLAPLSSELRETGLEFEGSPVYVGDWIKVNVGGRFYDIDGRDHVLFKFLVEHGDRVAKYVEDEEKRDVFLRLVELVRQLGPAPGYCARGGRVMVVSYSDLSKLYGEPVLCPLEGVRVCIGERCFYPPYLPSLLSLMPIMDSVERLYEEFEGFVEHNEGILGQMRRVARPYIVDKILG